MHSCYCDNQLHWRGNGEATDTKRKSSQTDTLQRKKLNRHSEDGHEWSQLDSQLHLLKTVYIKVYFITQLKQIHLDTTDSKIKFE